MPCYIVTHKLTKEISQAEMIECSKVLAAHRKDVKWHMSWYIPEQNHLICHFEAASTEAIQKALEESGVDNLFPVLKIQEAVEISPVAFAPRTVHARAKRRTRKQTA